MFFDFEKIHYMEDLHEGVKFKVDCSFKDHGDNLHKTTVFFITSWDNYDYLPEDFIYIVIENDIAVSINENAEYKEDLIKQLKKELTKQMIK